MKGTKEENAQNPAEEEQALDELAEYLCLMIEELERMACKDKPEEECEDEREEGETSPTGSEQPAKVAGFGFAMRWHTAAGGG